jgi:hypothetical protein
MREAYAVQCPVLWTSHGVCPCKVVCPTCDSAAGIACVTHKTCLPYTHGNFHTARFILARKETPE